MNNIIRIFILFISNITIHHKFIYLILLFIDIFLFHLSTFNYQNAYLLIIFLINFLILYNDELYFFNIYFFNPMI